MSATPVSSALLLCWRDTGHPQGGGSEAYLQRIGAELAATGVGDLDNPAPGVHVTMRKRMKPRMATMMAMKMVRTRWLPCSCRVSRTRLRPAAPR